MTSTGQFQKFTYKKVCDSAVHRKNARSLNIVTYNVQLGRKTKEITEAIQNSEELRNADVIMLQEIEAYPNEGLTRAEKIGDACDFNTLYVPARQVGEGTHGVAILSRHDLRDIQVIELHHCDLGKVTRRRIAVGCTITIDDFAIRVINVHFDTRITTEDRLCQLDGALALAKDFDGPVVLGGDLNATHFHPMHLAGFIIPVPSKVNQLAAIEERMSHAGFVNCVSEKSPTMRGLAGIFELRVDCIFARKMEAVRSAIVRDVTCTDHFPVMTELRF